MNSNNNMRDQLASEGLEFDRKAREQLERSEFDGKSKSPISESPEP